MSATEAADLARIILDDSEADRPMDLYTLNVHEARTLANAVIDQLDERGRTPDATEPLPCGCENPFNAIHLLDHRPTERRDQ